MKRCKTCKKKQPLKNFSRASDYKDGHIHKCKDCVNKRARERYKNKQKEPEDLPDEIWKDIPKYKGLYQASNKGRIKSLTRTKQITRKDGKVVNHTVYTRILKPQELKDGTGRLTVNLRKNNRTEREYIHRLIAMAFHGMPPKDKPFCCHKDDIVTNNYPENLYWGDKIDNNKDRRNNPHTHMNEGENCGTSKLTSEAVLEIRNSNLDKEELSDKFNVTIGTIDSVQSRRTWKHI